MVVLHGRLELAYMYVVEEYTKDKVNEGLKMYEALIKESEPFIRNYSKAVLGGIYYEGKENGLNVKENKKRGLKLVKEAAAEGEKKAIEQLKKWGY